MFRKHHLTNRSNTELNLHISWKTLELIHRLIDDCTSLETGKVNEWDVVRKMEILFGRSTINRMMYRNTHLIAEDNIHDD